jgi:hypothetical protein
MTEDLKSDFPTPKIYWELKNKTANRLTVRNEPGTVNFMKIYYYGGHRTRTMNRPTTYQLKFDWQKEIARVVDKKGTIWAITSIWWFGSYSDLWLISKKSECDTIWSGPWFTGVTIGLKAEYYSCSLEIRRGKMHLIIPQPGIDKIISPKILTSDRDEDGLYDLEEIRFTTDPDNKDSDGDGIIDGEDLNPLAKQKAELSDEDMVRLIVFRSNISGGYPYNLYIVPTKDDNKLEYYSASPNAIILSLNPQELKKYQENCYNPFRPDNFSISIDIKKESDSLMNAFISYKSDGIKWEVERRNGFWLLGKIIDRVIY